MPFQCFSTISSKATIIVLSSNAAIFFKVFLDRSVTSNLTNLPSAPFGPHFFPPTPVPFFLKRALRIFEYHPPIYLKSEAYLTYFSLPFYLFIISLFAYHEKKQPIQNHIKFGNSCKVLKIKTPRDKVDKVDKLKFINFITYAFFTYTLFL